MFVKIFNIFFEEGNKQLSPKELFLYFHLNLRRQHDITTTITSIDLLSQEIRFIPREDRNKKMIRSCLNSLKEKEHIIFELESEMKNNTMLKISYNNYKGYTQVFPYVYEMAQNEEEFTVLCLIEKYKGLDSYKISHGEFASVLERSQRFTIDLLFEMEQKGMINVVRGKYYVNSEGKQRKEMSQYRINPKYDSDSVLDNNSSHSHVTDEDSNSTEEKRDHKWYVYKSKLDADDMYIYLTTQDDVLKQRAEQRISIISRNEAGKQLMIKLEEEANYRIQSKNLLENRPGMSDSDILDQLNEGPKFKKQKRNDDISEFL